MKRWNRLPNLVSGESNICFCAPKIEKRKISIIKLHVENYPQSLNVYYI